jgi:flagellar hook assembly protein FlgD
MSIYPVQAATTQAGNSATTPSTSGSSTESAADYTSMFMQLLSTELQSQDPTQTMDPTTMVTQMVQINQLNDVAGIYSILQGAGAPASATTPTSAISTPTGTAHRVTGGN